MSKKLNVAMIGQGFMGKAHSYGWRNAGPVFGHSNLVPVMHTVAARDAGALTGFAARQGWQNTTTDWRKILENDEIDLVDITVPNHLHREMAIACLEAGKHVASEKPLAATLADARKMRDAAAANPDAKAYCWFNYRRRPAYVLAQRLIKSGHIGKVYHQEGRYPQGWGGEDTPLVWRFNAEIAGSGARGDLSAHVIDGGRGLTGAEVLSVQALETRYVCERALDEGGGADISGGGSESDGSTTAARAESSVDDASYALIEFDNGATGDFSSTRMATGEGNNHYMAVYGEKGAVKMYFARMNELWFYDATAAPEIRGWTKINVTNGENGHPYCDLWWPDEHVLGYDHTFVNQAGDITLELGGQEPIAPLVDFDDAYQTQRVLEAIGLSAEQGSKVLLSEVQ